MARILKAELDRLKREIPIRQLVEAHGVKLKRHGANLIGLCPFHDDKKPSLVISPDKNLWHCLGACQAGGSVIDWVMRVEGVSFRHAVELLRQGLPSLTAPSSGKGKPVKKSTVRKLPAPVQSSADDQKLLNQVVAYYHESLKQSPEALEYLEKRGLKSSEAVERFKLGYANRTLGYRLPDKNRKAGAQIRGHLQKLGILRKTGHEFFHGSLVIPVLDERGDVLEMYGRKIGTKLRKGTPLHLYLPGPHRGVWNAEALQACEEIILCESLIDALTFWCAGFRNVTASYGVEGFTRDHLQAFKRHGTKRVLIAYDRDEAGERAAVSLAKKLTSEGITCYRILFPKGMDANEYVRCYGPAAKSLDTLIRGAVWMGKGKDPGPRDTAATSSPAASSPTPAPPPPADPPRSTPIPKPSPASPTASPSGATASAASGPGPAPPTGSQPTNQAQPVAKVQASPEPPSPCPRTGAAVEKKPQEILIRLGDRRYRIRGLAKNLSYDQLKVNVLVARGDGPYHVDNLDLYSARHRAAYVKQAASELGVETDVIKKDLGRVLLELEELQDEQIRKALEPEDNKPVVLTDVEKEEALGLLRDTRLLDRMLADFGLTGLVGEETNKLVGYLAGISRKLEDPLAVIIQSSSAAGKTCLMEALLSFIPEEDRIKYSAMTGQALFYMGERNLAHKVLAIVEEEGAERANYALKLLQSEGELTIASTGKDPATGRLVTHEYHVQGPVMILLTTTAVEIDDELQNRSIILTVNEDREQTRAIHKRQRESQTLQGQLGRQGRSKVLRIHRNAQRLLRPLLVANPYATELTFLDDKTRTRRDHLKYLTLIRSIALLHQYQRPIKTITHYGKTVEYIEVTLDDIAVANRLAHEVLGRSLDELAPQTRRLLIAIDEMVAAECKERGIDRCDLRFTRRQIRESTGWTDSRLKIHLRRLEDLEYLLVHRGARGQSYVYELLYDGKGRDGQPFLMGLLDTDKLSKGYRYDAKKSGPGGKKSGPEAKKSARSQGEVNRKSGPSQGAAPAEKPSSDAPSSDSDAEVPQNALIGVGKKVPPRARRRRSRTQRPAVVEVN